jgi:hypothetical protein
VGVFVITACSRPEKPGYIITGTVEGTQGGEVVYLEEIQNMVVTKLDSTIVKKGKFTFKGHQDSTVLRYLSCITPKEAFCVPFFLENGELQVKMVSGNESVTGTFYNNTFQQIRSKMFKLFQQMTLIENDTTLTELHKETQLNAADRACSNVEKRGMRDNISNPVGIYLFKKNYYKYSLTENLELLKRIPAKYHNDIELQGIRKQLEAKQK